MPYQSGFCGGSSFAAESLTVSTQAVCRKWHQGQLQEPKMVCKDPPITGFKQLGMCITDLGLADDLVA